ncbi:DUF1398 domain-containing protein [Shimwellia blattae]|uniref:Phage envelope protein n=1 Tax=Shimwellia blattae (strain ATCC 29907 / DSM 4481 / JCM 1650 / NBRC 105725 / CDC 9005-74) TaxID=630626 RepID=I2B9J5_SHIBC|nr:DUF1398 domain-containing protein [Shimwellia blattae]AFJ47199.1 hypothetical protein EBL_c21080 [Shimwellia blattae DSM 4481 = NBRC 105725]GAB82272.1 hypothetical protein EB105725_21_00700 [Shimwellia blattae DSM 4481 = NBRC 105725]VDY64687.1 Phage envelope protein [Shimwellia blattae]VEC22791.1 Phage envelope protein [Shimwellia blattae]
MELHAMLNRFFEQVRSNADFPSFITELRRNDISYYIYFVATGNVKIVTTSDTYMSVKTHRGLIKINQAACSRLVRIVSRRHFSGKTTYDQYCKELAKAGVFKWVVDVNEQMRHYWSKDNQLLHSEQIIMSRPGE